METKYHFAKQIILEAGEFLRDHLYDPLIIDEKTNPNFFYSTGGTKEEYIEYISSSMGVKRKDFEKAISNPWKSKILSYVGNYCPND